MKNKVLATILFSLLVVPLVQSADNSPRLVVGITVVNAYRLFGSLATPFRGKGF